VKKIISICPHCVRTIQEDWKEYGTPPEIEHHSEFLARFADKLPAKGADLPLKGTGFSPYIQPTPKSEGALAPAAAPEGYGLQPVHSTPQNELGALAPAAPEKIVFHDPCYLGRYRNVYDEPRAVIAAAGTLVEAERNHERSFCCGAGGGLAFLGEETGQRVSSVRAQELVATGATTIGVACPFCNTMFRDALASGDNTPRLLDIAQIAAMQLPSSAPGPQA
jgi:Fe-S oxidoreductase